ncbi:4a-hydroxytetrahydrobiopterin dehydratase [soil metagenome]|jgi:4a-hydroxytetrahydrobiopterin dehydratase
MEDFEKEIKELTGWEKVENKISKNFKFKDFIEAFSFVTRIAIISEKMNHHPDITISFNSVHIDLTTHDINSISKNDIILARKIEELI